MVSPDLDILYLPSVLIPAVFMNFRGIMILLVVQPFFHLRELLQGEYTAVFFLLGASYISTAAVVFYVRVLRGKMEYYRESLNKLHSGALDIVATSPSFGKDELLSQYLVYIQEIEKDIMDILIMAERSLAADSVNLFLIEGGELTFRFSSSLGEMVLLGEGLIYQVVTEKGPVLKVMESRGEIKPGYLVPEGLSSIMAMPVMDGATVLGVVSADSARYRAFDQKDLELFELYASEVSKVLRRQRIYSQVEREYKSLDTLHKESARFLELLNISDIGQRIVDSAEKISDATAALILKRGRRQELIMRGDSPRPVKTLKGSLLEMVVTNREAVYRTDTGGDEIRHLPFKTKDVRSLIAIPIFHQDKVQGVLTVFSEEPDAFNTYLFELLKVLMNQASLSISNALLHEELRQIAFTDGLTGLFNHRHFQERLTEEFKKAERFQDRLSLILTDIDHFKRVNDTYGHPAGDAVLKGFSEIIRKTVREIDIPARYGGEEFAVLVLKADAGEAKKIAERIRKNVESHDFVVDGQILNITVSLGIASYPADVGSREKLIEEADHALYKAKESGRNRTVCVRV
ncbi:response regulator PleD [bacterium BMS3Abin08]|nr:response regulator PleD [bacterium BMS3Abin08]